jgi:hypothetical protein
LPRTAVSSAAIRSAPTELQELTDQLDLFAPEAPMTAHVRLQTGIGDLADPSARAINAQMKRRGSTWHAGRSLARGVGISALPMTGK